MKLESYHLNRPSSPGMVIIRSFQEVMIARDEASALQATASDLGCAYDWMRSEILSQTGAESLPDEVVNSLGHTAIWADELKIKAQKASQRVRDLNHQNAHDLYSKFHGLLLSVSVINPSAKPKPIKLAVKDGSRFTPLVFPHEIVGKFDEVDPIRNGLRLIPRLRTKLRFAQSTVIDIWVLDSQHWPQVKIRPLQSLDDS